MVGYDTQYLHLDAEGFYRKVAGRRIRVSKTGLSIKAGEGGDSEIVAKYPGRVCPLDEAEFVKWLDEAESICDEHNANIDAAAQQDVNR